MAQVRAGGTKWKSRAAAAAPDYKIGVQNPRRPWDQATIAAADNYAQGVQQAVTDGRFARGVSRVGQAGWQARASTIGVQRYAQGIQASGDRYDRGFAPYKSVIESTTLPPRGPRGDINNYQRVVTLGQALSAAKVANKAS